MKTLSLQPRLQFLAALVPQGTRLADVGTDHGYLPVALLQQGRITSAVASDIAAEPLRHARRTAEEYGVDGIDFRLCGGLDGITPEEVDTVVIAGMGGETIASILSDAAWTKAGKTLLLQPMTKIEFMRGWLGENGYVFEQERLVWDKGNLYPIFVVHGGESRKLSEMECYSGVALTGDPLYGDYLDAQISRLQRAIDGLHRADGKENQIAAGKKEILCRALQERREGI